MTNIRKHFIWIAISIVVLLLVFIFFWLQNHSEIPSISQESESILEKDEIHSGSMEFPEAPHPFQEDPDLEGEAKRLWPEVVFSQNKKVDREKIRDEWNDFAKRYPKNIYIPKEFRPQLSSAEEKARLEKLDKISAAEAQFALAKGAGRYSEPGAQPSANSMEPKVTPSEQKAYFEYKIEELESRIQLIEYSINERQIDSSQLEEAKRDLLLWRKELEQVKQVLETVPAS
ncbi:hypothetical protein CH373_00260 [Leptospira perolatii]|uniref:Uncharacterized protein n=1 Tax=Leptospira perolatii TaxID=2023191 RepID=A0A2M9ZR27_9LEPT|nr:hypothetical protein [Leptospira perolatii]PJZ71005.1 hypothetical protein CH360_00260 [Leptospira perolatii]PJZ74537.1 hypothetical protein CH373_00260 [Leptospira perolatii]